MFFVENLCFLAKKLKNSKRFFHSTHNRLLQTTGSCTVQGTLLKFYQNYCNKFGVSSLLMHCSVLRNYTRWTIENGPPIEKFYSSVRAVRAFEQTSYGVQFFMVHPLHIKLVCVIASCTLIMVFLKMSNGKKNIFQKLFFCLGGF